MFRPVKRPFVSLVLIAATALLGIVPAVGACESGVAKCSSNRCCGNFCARATEATHACCRASAKPQTCRCSVDEERPAVPCERQSRDERNDARRVEVAMAVLFVLKDEVWTSTTEDAALFSSLPATRRQAVLCRWLT